MSSIARSTTRVAWISDFPVEWWPGRPASLSTPRGHPATWQRVLLGELQHSDEVELHVFTLREGLPADLRFTEGNTTFHMLRVPPVARTASGYWIDTVRLRAAVRAVAPDVVHAWGTDRGAATVASRLGYPTVVTMQGILGWYATQVRPNLRERVAGVFEDRALTAARHVTTESTFAVRWLAAHYPHLRVHRIEHAPAHGFASVERRPVPGGNRLLFVGKFERRKGADVLLEALAQMPVETPWHLTVLGDVDSSVLHSASPAVRDRIVPRVTFSGTVPSEEVAKAVSTATLLVFPTRADTSPNSVKEAVVAGLPVVATGIGGVPDYVLDNLNGILVPTDSPKALSLGIARALRHPLLGRGQVDPGALRKGREHLDPARMAREFLGVYRIVHRASLVAV